MLPDMPARVLRRVEKRLPLADWEELLAIVDMTALGDGRAFMASPQAAAYQGTAFGQTAIRRSRM